MSDCKSCIHYYEESDVDFFECKKNMEDKYWDGDIDCPEYAEIENIGIRRKK